MYTIKRDVFRDTLKIKEDNEVVKTLKININIAKTAHDYRIAQTKIWEAQKLLKEGNSDDAALIEQIGNAVLDLYKIIFGEETVSELMEYYQNAEEMINNIFPYIQEVVTPVFKKYRDKKLKQIR